MNLVILSLLFVTIVGQLYLKTRGEYISPWDEMYHFSYVQYIYDWHVPRYGDVLNTWARHGFSCYPVWPFGMTTAVPCGEIAAPSFYPEGGTNTAAIWPPVYYLLVASFLHIFVPFGYDPFVFARLATVLIWSIGCLLIAIALNKSGVSRLVSGLIAVLLSSLPLATFHGAFITPHSMIPILVAGYLFLFRPIFASKELGLKRLFWSLLYSIIIGLSVPQAVSLVAIFSGLASIQILKSILQMKNKRVRVIELGLMSAKLLLAAAPVAGTYFTNRLWGIIQERRTVGWQETVNLAAQQVAQPPSDPALTPAQLLEAVWRFFPRTVDAFQFQGTLSTGISQFWMYFLVAGVGALILSEKRLYVQLAALLTVVVGVAFSIYMELVIPVAIAPRYGLSVVITGLALSSFAINNKISKYLFAIAVIATWIVTLNSIPFKS